MSDPDDVAMPSDVAEVEPQAVDVGADPMADPEASSGRSGLVDMLTSTEPNVSPREASGAFDPEVPWHKDFEAGLQKMTGTGGTPAVVHAIVAAAKLATGQELSLPTGGSGGGDTDATGDGADVVEVGDL